MVCTLPAMKRRILTGSLSYDIIRLKEGRIAGFSERDLGIGIAWVPFTPARQRAKWLRDPAIDYAKTIIF